MPRIRAILLGALVIFGAVGASSARAGEYVIESKGLGEGETREVRGTSGVSKLEASIGKVNVTVECLKGTTKGALQPAGASEGEASFNECKLLNASHEVVTSCKITEPVEVRFTDQLIENAESKGEDEYKPTKAEETFVEVKIEGSLCAFKGTYKIKGTQTCALPKGEEESLEHKIECQPSGSKLTLGAESATFTDTQNVKLASGKKWAALRIWFSITANNKDNVLKEGEKVTFTFTNTTRKAKLKMLDSEVEFRNFFFILKEWEKCGEKEYEPKEKCSFKAEYEKNNEKGDMLVSTEGPIRKKRAVVVFGE